MGKVQPANVGLNRVIKHQLKQSQLKYLIETYRKQVDTGLTAEQVKFLTSLPELWNASVAGIVEVYNFLNSPTGCEFVKKVCYSFDFVSK